MIRQPYRAPKSAVPMRTSVAPSAMADSKSPLIPIDSVSSLRPPAFRSVKRRSQAREHRTLRGGVGLRRRHAHQAPQAQPGQAGDGASRGPADSSGATPPLVGSGTSATWMQTLSGGAWNGRCSDSRRATLKRSTLCTQSKRSAMAASLVGLDAADEVPLKLQVGELVHFDQQPPADSFRRNP